MSQAGQRILITGASGNLGRALAALFAGQGQRLMLLDRDAAALQQLCADLPGETCGVAADLTDAQDTQRAVAACSERFAGVDVLCNLAGGFRMGEPVHATAQQTWDLLMGLNAATVLHTAQAVVPRMLAAGGGAIVNVGAAGAARGGAGMGAYAASKSAVARLTEAMSAELRGQGIRVNCVLPSILDTPENRRDMPKADFGQWVHPADLAQVIAFLCSPAAAAVHGASIPVTGLV